jgi:anion-transporting  ArsA/GET3 family ATPase
MGTQLVLKTLGRFTGQDFFQELGEFLFHFSGLLDGIRDRSDATQLLLRAPDTRFVIVTTPDPSTVDESMGFRKRLDAFGVHVGGVVVNRAHQNFGHNDYTEQPINVLTDALAADAPEPAPDRARLTRLASAMLDNTRAFKALAARDDEAIAALRESLGEETPVVRVPMYATDVHTINGLLRMRADLFGE